MSGRFTIRREVRPEGGAVAHLTIDNSTKLNSLNSALMREIVTGMQALAAEPELRLAILGGAGGRAFIGGADIRELAALDRDTGRAFIEQVHACCDAFRRLPVPVIARIDGFALGAGLEVAISCDLRVVSDRSSFGMPEVRIGVPSVVEAALLPRLIGAGRTRRMLFTGDPIDAATALDWGLVDSVVPAERLDTAVAELAEPILASGPRAIRLQKQLILDWEERHADAAIERGIESLAAAYDTNEPAERIGALLVALASRRRG